jgi:hypothetical protein
MGSAGKVLINSSAFRKMCYNKPPIHVIRAMPGIGARCLSLGVSGSHDTYLLPSSIMWL